MTSQAVLKSMRSTSVKRMTLNGRSERFLDTLAFYNCRNVENYNVFGRKVGRNDGSLRFIPEKLGRRYVQKEASFTCSKSIIDNEKEFNIDFRVDGRPLPGHKHLLKEVAIALQVIKFYTYTFLNN